MSWLLQNQNYLSLRNQVGKFTTESIAMPTLVPLVYDSNNNDAPYLNPGIMNLPIEPSLYQSLTSKLTNNELR